MKLLTKERLVSGGIGAAAAALGLGIWQHFHRQPREQAHEDHHAANDRGEYGHHGKHHHRKEG